MAQQTTIRNAGLDELVGSIRTVMSSQLNWEQTARLAAHALNRRLPTADVLTEEQLLGDPEGYRSHVLHSEPDGSFSVVAVVWRPRQVTQIHDHVAWCALGVVQGVEYEELFTLDEERNVLLPAGTNVNEVGDVSGFAPPGDIHRVRNHGDETAISIHVYGTDVTRIGSSVRRYYDLPVLRATTSAQAAARTAGRAQAR